MKTSLPYKNAVNVFSPPVSRIAMWLSSPIQFDNSMFKFGRIRFLDNICSASGLV